MPLRSASTLACARCNGLREVTKRPRRGLGARELMLGAAALGLVLGVSAVDERYACHQLEAHPQDHAAALAERDAALDAELDARCEASSCAAIELVSTRGCLAKIRLEGERVDAYGEVLGVYRTVEGLEYSPLLQRWSLREVLSDKLLLGF